MTPDELVALADASEGVAAYHRGDTDDLADGPTMIQAYAKLKALAPSLARDHAALLDWAANIAHATRRRDQALRIYWDYFSEGAIKTARWRGNDHHAEDWWTRYERYQKRVEVLLVEWAEMQERPS